MGRQIFISYSKKDAEIANRIAGDLERAGLNTWVDREIGGGQQWRRTIEKSIEESAEMIVLISKNSLDSRWVQHESSVAYGLDKSIVPVLIGELPDENHFVWMDEIQYIDLFNPSYEEGFVEVLRALTPPNPVQDLLDQQMIAYRQTGDLIGAAMLEVIEESRSTLTITPEQEALIAESAQTVAFRRRLLRGGVGLVIALVVVAIVAIGAVIQADAQRNQLVQTQQAAETQIVQLATQQAMLGVQATAAVIEATRQVGVFQEELDNLGLQATSVFQAQTTAQALADAAQAQLDRTEKQLKGILDEEGLVLVQDGPIGLLAANGSIWVANRDSNTVQHIDPDTRKAVQTYNVGALPVDVLVVEDTLWAANYGDDTVSKIDLTTGVVQDFPVGSGPRALAYDGQSIWLVNETDNTLVRLNPETGAVTLVVEVGNAPVDLTFVANFVWVANFEANTIQRVDPNQGRVVSTIPVGKGPSALLWDGANLWVANRVDDVIQQVNPNTGGVLRVIPVADAPSALAFDGASLWVANRGNDSVQMIDIQSSIVLATFSVGDFPRSLAWDGKNLWTANYNDRNLQILDREAGAIVSAVDVGDSPTNMLVESDSIWVISRGEKAVEEVDLLTEDVVSNFALGGFPQTLVSTGTEVWATDFSGDSLVKVANLIGTPDLEEEEDVITAIPVGSGPRFAVWDGEAIWTANFLDDSLSRVDPITGGLLLLLEDIGDGPYQLLIYEQGLWVSLWNDLKLVHFDLATGLQDLTIGLADRPIDLAVDGEGLWVLVNNSLEITKYDLLTGAPLVTIPVPDGNHVDLLAANGYLWLVEQNEDRLYALDLETGEVVHSILAGDDPAFMVAVNGDIWISTQSGNELRLIDGTVLERLEQSKELNESAE